MRDVDEELADKERGRPQVQIGAILTLAGRDEATRHSSHTNGNASAHHLLPGPLSPILGKSLLERTLECLDKAGTSEPKIIAEAHGQLFAPTGHLNGHGKHRERAIAELVGQGAGLLIFIDTDAYSDLDYEELVGFHLARRAGMTRVYTSDGPLGVGIVSVAALGSGGDYGNKITALAETEACYLYHGYLNRLASAQDLRRLVDDGLNRRCGLSPSGREVQAGIWIGDGAEVDSTSAITSPAFIGEQARVAAYAALHGSSAIERHSEIDCGTSLEEAWVLEDSYVGIGLDVRRSIVYQNTLFHLERNLAVGIADRRLLGPVSGFSCQLHGASVVVEQA
jgi:hypothetical protein